MDSQTLAYKVDEGAHQLGVSRSMMWKLISGGEIKTFSAGRKRLIAREELLRFISDGEAAREAADAERVAVGG